MGEKSLLYLDTSFAERKADSTHFPVTPQSHKQQKKSDQ